MGESPREQAASEANTQIAGYMGSMINGGANSADARFGKMSPMIENAISQMTKSFGLQMGAVRGSAGQQLVQGGVAGGGDINTSFLGAVAPAAADVAKTRGGMEMSKVDLLNSLFTNQDASYFRGGGVQAANIGNMKDSTLAGDILGGVTGAANVAAGLFGPTGLLTSLLRGGGTMAELVGGESPTGLTPAGGSVQGNAPLQLDLKKLLQTVPELNKYGLNQDAWPTQRMMW